MKKALVFALLLLFPNTRPPIIVAGKPDYQNTFWIGCMNAYLDVYGYKGGQKQHDKFNKKCNTMLKKIRETGL